jgi:CubicO group peptidase (beta-lactamase class C family)
MKITRRPILLLAALLAIGAAAVFAAFAMGGIQLVPRPASATEAGNLRQNSVALSTTEATVALDPAPLIARIEGRQPRGQGLHASHTLEAMMKQQGVPGLSVAVIHNFQVHWTKGYGVADVTSGRRVDTTTMFQAASISKPVAAVIAMTLVQDKRFGLDDDIHSIVRSWRVPGADSSPSHRVTPRSLMSHTSGADDGYGFPGYAPGTPVPTLQQILAGERPANRGPVLFARPPYRAFKYSGGGWVVMQLAMQEVTGQPFDELARTRLLDPLGMRNSTFTQPGPGAPDAALALAHSRRGERLAAPWHIYPEQSAAGLWTTASDLAKVAIELQRALRDGQGTVLEESSARALTTLTGVGPFAVGFAVERLGEGWYFAHTGDNYGFQGGLWAHLRHGYGIVVLGNSQNARVVVEELRTRVAHAYDWDAVHEPLRR